MLFGVLDCLVAGSQGETEEAALENIRDAIEAYLETVQELTRDKQCRAFTMAGIVKDAGLSTREFKKLL
jgi:hypothetical protein